MADYEVKAPPNLRSVDCCATCVRVEWQHAAALNCTRFRRELAVGVEPYKHPVSAHSLCDAFEREVQK